jgi:transposase-like protein
MNAYQRHRFPPDITSYAVWLYFRFNLSHRDIEDILAERELTLDTIHDTSQYANNRAELSHQSTGVRERVMRRFKSAAQTQRLLAIHAAAYNLFDPGRHLVRARHYRKLRIAAFGRRTIAIA